MKIHNVRTRKGNKYGKKRRKRLGYIFHGGGFTDVQSSHASYRLSLLVNLLTRTVLSLPFEKAKVEVLNSDEQGVVHGRTAHSTQVYSSL